MEPNFLKSTNDWMLGEDIPNADLFFSTIWLNGFVSNFDENTGLSYSRILCKYEGYHLWFYFGEKDSFEVGEHIANRIINEPGYASEINRHIILEADKLSAFSATIPQTDLQKLTNSELWRIYSEHQRIHAEYYSWCWIPVAVDMFHNNLTNRVKEYLRSRGVAEEKMAEDFIILTQPTTKSLIFVEQESLLKIAAEIQKDTALTKACLDSSPEDLVTKLPSEILTMLQKHHDTYYYTKHLWVEGEFTIIDYAFQLKEILSIPEDAEAVLSKQYAEISKARIKREALLSNLKVDESWRAILEGFGNFMVTKIYRRYAQLLAVHHMSPILKEIARRFFLTEKQVRFMRFVEVKDLLLNEKVNASEMLERTKMCVYYAERDYEKVFVGDEARNLLKRVEKEYDKNVTEIKGEVACVGYAKGRVKIVIRAEDMIKMNQGDILVSIATDPDIVPAMKKAGAIVTEQGGVTSHAAIVSRELGIPCVIGTKIATRVLKDGDMVEVDANKGIVKKI